MNFFISITLFEYILKTINLLMFNQWDSRKELKQRPEFQKSTIKLEPGHYLFTARKYSTLFLPNLRMYIRCLLFTLYTISPPSNLSQPCLLSLIYKALYCHYFLTNWCIQAVYKLYLANRKFLLQCNSMSSILIEIVSIENNFFIYILIILLFLYDYNILNVLTIYNKIIGWKLRCNFVRVHFYNFLFEVLLTITIIIN